VNEVLQRLSAVRDELVRLAETEKTARNVVSNLKIQKAVIARDQERAEADLIALEEVRDEAVRRLRLFAEKRLLEEAGDNLQPEKIDLAASPAVELARRIEQALATVPADEEAWKRVQSGSTAVQ
jgi:hypothetical protein